VVTLESLNRRACERQNAEGPTSKEILETPEKMGSAIILDLFQAAVAFGAVMTGLEAGRHLKWW
jgi:hypothetical protein